MEVRSRLKGSSGSMRRADPENGVSAKVIVGAGAKSHEGLNDGADKAGGVEKARLPSDGGRTLELEGVPVGCATAFGFVEEGTPRPRVCCGRRRRGEEDGPLLR